MSLTKVSYSMLAGSPVNVTDFGAIGNGTTDDTAAIQAAINYCFTNDKNLIGATGATYLISATIIIPQRLELNFAGISIDFCEANFKLASDITLFKSASWNSTLGSMNSFGIHFGGFTILVPTPGTVITSEALQIQDWHQNCTIQNITALDVSTILSSNNCFYCFFDNIQTQISSGVQTGTRFKFTNSHNLNKLSRLQAASSVIGYYFSSGVTACQITNVSIEGCTTGFSFIGTVYDAVIENSYFEGFDTAVYFGSNVGGVTLKNNYVNFLNSATAYFVDYVPLPLNNIKICDDNFFQSMVSDANIIKTLDEVYSQGVTVQRFKTAMVSLSDLVVDNTEISSKVDWQKKVSGTSMLANVVNKYITGNYSGQMTGGYDAAHGFVDGSSGVNMYLVTNIMPSATQIIYVNIQINLSGIGLVYIRGQFVGTHWVDLNSSYAVPYITAPATTVQINAVFGVAISTPIFGEIRLI